MNNRVRIGNVIKFAGAYVACAIGSGFATGQEILQFFTSFGRSGIIGTFITMVVFAWCGGVFMKNGYELQLDAPGDIVGYYFGSRIAKVFGIITQVFLYGVYIIMIAGAGATLSEYFGLDPMVGRIGMALLAFLTVILGLSKLTDILGSLGTAIIVFSVGIGIYSFLSNPSGISAAEAVLPTVEIEKAAGNWFLSGLLYPSFNAVVVVILSGGIGKSASSAREAFLGGALGGVLFGLAVLAMDLGLLANFSAIAGKSVPTLVLADRLSPIFGTIFAVIICCGIYTTTVPMLWGCVRQFAKDKSAKFIILAAALTAVGLVLGMTDFKKLVNIIYPFSGYFGLALLAFAFFRNYIQPRIRRKER